MKDKQIPSLAIALHGMDGRTYKTMVMYFQGPCKAAAVVVDDSEAAVADMVDADTNTGKQLLHQWLAQPSLSRPLIVLSKDHWSQPELIVVEKPIRLNNMLAAFAAVNHWLEQFSQHGDSEEEDTETEEVVDEAAEGKINSVANNELDPDESRKTAKHKTAMQLDESTFSSFIGIIPGIDFTDEQQVIKAYYSPKNYFQGYVLSAYKVALEKNRMLQLNSSWKPLLIFPRSREVWLDADDKQLRAFAALEMNKATGSKLTVTAINLDTSGVRGKLDRFHDMDVFIWKLAVWTSKGRYPQIVDIHKPIFIKQWPNFTRLLITPHALRITALLIQYPRTMLEVTRILKIAPQYVFVFVSAAYSLGLVGQLEVKIPEPEVASAEGNPETEPQNKSLLSKILGKLRTTK